MAFRHALRVSELVDIRWQQIDLDTATIHIRRAKNGTRGIHGLQGDELRLCGHYDASILMQTSCSYPSERRRCPSTVPRS
jgi:integrase